MLIRSTILQKNQSAGRWDDTPLITVHQRPPKKKAPRIRPPANGGANNRNSFIFIRLLVPDFLVFLRHPMPCIQTTDGKAGRQ